MWLSGALVDVDSIENSTETIAYGERLKVHASIDPRTDPHGVYVVRADRLPEGAIKAHVIDPHGYRIVDITLDTYSVDSRFPGRHGGDVHPRHSQRRRAGRSDGGHRAVARRAPPVGERDRLCHNARRPGRDGAVLGRAGQEGPVLTARGGGNRYTGGGDPRGVPVTPPPRRFCRRHRRIGCRPRILACAAVLAAAAAALPALAAAAPPAAASGAEPAGFEVRTVADGLEVPWSMDIGAGRPHLFHRARRQRVDHRRRRVAPRTSRP